ncbi:unnamed protein product [Absidia cylindrospora]
MNVQPIATISKATSAVFYGVGLFGMTGLLQTFQIPSMIIGPFSPRLLVKINSYLVGTVWRVLQTVFEKRKKGHITFSGDIVPASESALVISNHRSWIDFYMIHSVAIRRNMLPNCKYFVKDSIKWLPFFGWGMWLAGFMFVRRNWLQDQTKINKTFASMKTMKTPAWIINYVEGSRFTPEKSQQCQAFCRERGYTTTENVLLPRTRGFTTCVREFRNSHIEYIYDFTLAYRHHSKNAEFNEAPDMVRVHTSALSPEYEFHVNVKRYAISDLPTDDEGIAQWLRQRYVEKDQFLAQLRDRWTDGLDIQVREEEW